MKMGKPSRVCPLYYCLPALFLLLIEYALSLEMLDDCRGLVSCLKCDGSNTTQCTKCSQLVLRSRECSFLSCPPGYTSKKTNLMDYMTTICQERLRTKGLSGEVVGASAGIILCVLTALAFGLYCKYIRRSSKRPPSLSHSTQASEPVHWAVHASPTKVAHHLYPKLPPGKTGSEESERECMEYLKEIRELRTEAPVFLDMLNETRKQVRTLPSYALQPYKPVLKDLSRILILLNKPDSKLTIPPPDWETLLAWAHRILGRYKKHHNNQCLFNVREINIKLEVEI
ncbi:FU domain-containing protein T48 isoform X2 [Rhodnius prolixus]|uniref:FU domain-containing protein T48 isoform X2 n=1 Tax=Rhodnius prolixus TaxID=13249 RepID=UPI003D18BE02